jgi:dihydrofolate reductase
MKVILMMASTVDGKIGRTSHEFPDWTGKEDKIMFKQATQRAGVVIMGSKTYDAIGKPLPGRKNVVLTRNKQRVSRHENLVYSSAQPHHLLQELHREGFNEVVLAGGSIVNSLFAREDLIDEIHITFAPRVFGQGISLFSETLSMALQLLAVERLGADYILAKFRVIKTSASGQ